MTDTLTEHLFDLGASRTYKGGRVATWVPGECKLTITLRKTPGGKAEEDVYEVQEETPPAPGVRSFLLLNKTDATQKDIYQVVVGRYPSCTCDGHQTDAAALRCKHFAAVQKVVENPTPEEESAHDSDY